MIYVTRDASEPEGGRQYFKQEAEKLEDQRREWVRLIASLWTPKPWACACLSLPPPAAARSGECWSLGSISFYRLLADLQSNHGLCVSRWEEEECVFLTVASLTWFLEGKQG